MKINQNALGWILLDVFLVIMLIPITLLWPLWRLMDWIKVRELENRIIKYE